jgi:hypothetical protein
MAFLYVRPNLVDFGDSTGYSLTSGGPSANRLPSFASDTVVFDSNSGPRRTISGTLPIVQLLMTVSMDLVNVVQLTKDSYLWGSVPGVILSGVYNDNSFSNVFELGAGQCTIGSQGLKFDGDGYWRISGPLTTTGRLAVDAGSGTQYLYCSDGFSITCGSISVTGGSGVLFVGTSLNLTVTGAPSSSGGNVCNIQHINGTSTNTIAITDKSALVKGIVLADGAWSVTNNTGNGQGTGGIQLNSNPTFGIFDCGKNAAVTTFVGGNQVVATNWIMDGSGQYSIVKSSSTTPVTLAKSGGGTIAANFCNFNYINAATSPATAIRATNSKLTGGGTGITLVGMTSRFMPFF